MTTPPLDLPALRAELRAARRVAKQHMNRADKAEQERDTKAEACRTMGHIIELQGQWAVEATGSQDLIGEDGDGDWDVVWDRVTELGDKARQATARAVAAEAAIARVRELASPDWCLSVPASVKQAILERLDGGS